MKGIIIFCEGKSDVAFLSLLIKQIDFKDYKVKVEEMIKPLKEYFISQFDKYEYESNELLKRPILPWIYKKRESQGDNIYILLYSMDGLGKIDNIKPIIESFIYQQNADETFGDDQLPFSKSILSFAFFIDADNIGIKERVELIKKEFIKYFPEIEKLGHGKDAIVTTKVKPFKNIGCYVITKEESEYGNLEDVLIPIMEKGKEEEIFNNAENFLKKNNFVRYKPDKKGEKIKDENKTKSDLKKSIIGVAGQLECSGNDNTEIILNSSFLQGKFDNDLKSLEIIEFIKKLRSEIRNK